MPNKDITLQSLEEIEDQKVYNINYLMAALKLYGLPASLPSIKKYEAQGIIQRHNLLSYQRKYTGLNIKKIIHDLIGRVEDGS